MKRLNQIRLPRAILFDHDGVLAQSEPLHWAAWREVLRELKLPYVKADIQALVGATSPEIMTQILDQHRPGWSKSEYDIHALAQLKNDHYMRTAQTELQAYPGVPELLSWLGRVGIKTAVVSNARKLELESALKLIGIFERFDAVISRDDAGCAKPDPTPYLMAASSLGFEPKDCLAVEDSPTGIEAALIAKIPSAAVLTNFTREVMEHPVPGRPDLTPVWIGESVQALFEELMRIALPSSFSE
jgi:HAD superfamily hydrolase (TIGR01509 family)